jgi:hypothetical protein
MRKCAYLNSTNQEITENKDRILTAADAEPIATTLDILPNFSLKRRREILSQKVSHKKRKSIIKEDSISLNQMPVSASVSVSIENSPELEALPTPTPESRRPTEVSPGRKSKRLSRCMSLD